MWCELPAILFVSHINLYTTMKKPSFGKLSFRNILQRFPALLKLVAITLTIVGLMAVAFPKVSFDAFGREGSFDGIDVSDLTNNKVPYEFQFSPSLDFYGGSEVSYTVSEASKQIDQSYNKQLAAKLSERLANLGLTNFDVYVRGREETAEGDNKGKTVYEIVAELPKTSEEVQNFNQLLSTGGEISFVKQRQTPAEEGAEDAEPQTTSIPTALSRGDVINASVIYTAETFGYGLAVDFNSEKLNELLFTAVSDVNSDAENQLILAVGGQAVAWQTVAMNSGSKSTRLVFGSQLGNDQLAANLIREMLVNPSITEPVTSNGAVKKIPGKFDALVPFLKVATIIILLLVSTLTIIKQKLLGLVSALNILFAVILTVAVAKIGMLPISIVSIFGAVLALTIWTYHTRSLLPAFFQKPSTKPNIYEWRDRLFAVRRDYLRFFILSGLICVLLSTVKIPALVDFGGNFLLASTSALVSFYLFTGNSLDLLKLNLNNTVKKNEEN